jgi:hypothetical protein
LSAGLALIKKAIIQREIMIINFYAISALAVVSTALALAGNNVQEPHEKHLEAEKFKVAARLFSQFTIQVPGEGL